MNVEYQFLSLENDKAMEKAEAKLDNKGKKITAPRVLVDWVII